MPATIEREHIELRPQINRDLEWNLSWKGPVIVMSSGNIYIKDKKPKGLTLVDVSKLFSRYPRSGYIAVKLRRTVTLKEALKWGIHTIGTKRQYRTTIDFFKVEHDRVFESRPFNGMELLSKIRESKPIKVKE